MTEAAAFAAARDAADSGHASGQKIPDMHGAPYSFRDACAFIRAKARSEREKGALFEQLIADWLQTDPAWSAAVDRVWLWPKFAQRLEKSIQPGIFTNRDMGIDLVAEMKGGQFWAFQCKLYGPDTVMSKSDVDSFVSECGKRFVLPEGERGFSRGVWVHEGGQFGKNARDALLGQRIPFTCISGDDLDCMEGIDWRALAEGTPFRQRPAKELRSHQEDAAEAARIHFAEHARGRMIMACGTGKTLTSLRIVERNLAGRKDGLVLFLVPSISLLGQTLNAWMADRSPDCPMHAVCVCSDPKVSKKAGAEDTVMDGVLDLAYPASTDSGDVLRQLELFRGSGTVAVFSTYQSAGVVAEAQKKLLERGGQGVFDWIICDEAHRTAGAARPAPKAGKAEEGADEPSFFFRVHSDAFIRAKRRLYMTATPKLYRASAKRRAEEKNAMLWSMDDEDVFGKEFYRLDFGKAVGLGLLADYKVAVLTLVPSLRGMPEKLKSAVMNPETKEIDVDVATRLAGTVGALCKRFGEDSSAWTADPGVMKRGIVFCGRIGKEDEPGSSKNVASILPLIAEAVFGTAAGSGERTIRVEARHVDGSMDAAKRNAALAWLREGPQEPDGCRLLCNVRCLSEGIDVPALDAAVYLAPRRSQIDVVQSVGRVMRSFRRGQEGEKKYGYVILPIVVPPEVRPEDALNDNERYRAVWEVLNALRAHDKRFDIMIGQLGLGGKLPEPIIPPPPAPPWPDPEPEPDPGPEPAPVDPGSFRNMLCARIVEKVGDRFYWDRWATEAGETARKLSARIAELVEMDRAGEVSPGHGKGVSAVFGEYMAALKETLGKDAPESQGVGMLAQCMVTEPVFDGLFPAYRFGENSDVARSLKSVLLKLEGCGLMKDAAALEKFYAEFRQSVRENVGQIEAGQQEIVRTLYEKFFSQAFPEEADRLGIVYTPVELVDFVLRSADAVLWREFGRKLADEGVSILDPFAGTGTFPVRLMQTGLAGSGDVLLWKYGSEIFANEIVPLAYFIADVNIENAFNAIRQKEYPGIEYRRFENISLTDTFSLENAEAPWARTWHQAEGPESDGKESSGPRFMTGRQFRLPGMEEPLFQKNAMGVESQQWSNLQVIVGNPPYNAGKKSANDSARNRKYPMLGRRIEQTYAAESEAVNRNSLYDSYILAFRWASDRIPDGEGGVIAFVTNAGWLDGAAAAGMRRSLEREFAGIYVVNLRGDCRTSGELRRREGDNIFAVGSRAPVAVTVLVKKPGHEGKAAIRCFKVEDYMSREDKLRLLKETPSVLDLPLKTVEPDEHGDWLNHRDRRFEDWTPIGDKKTAGGQAVFCGAYSRGLATARDPWCWNYSKVALEGNVRWMIDAFNACVDSGKKDRNPRKISWSRGLLERFDAGRKLPPEACRIVETAAYRPFVKERVCFSREMNDMIYRLAGLFPEGRSGTPVICMSGGSSKRDFSCLMIDCLPDLHFIGDTQCFPLRWWGSDRDAARIQDAASPLPLPGMKPARRTRSVSLFEASGTDAPKERDGVSDWALKHVRSLYPGHADAVSKEDVFFYVYGLLHSRDYRTEFAADLKKSLPRIPFPADFGLFGAFSRAGRLLGDLHLRYEDQPPWPEAEIECAGSFEVDAPRWLDEEKTAVRLGPELVLRGIPARAHEYAVNGKSALDWLVERYAVRTDRDSGIMNDPNAWALEQGKPRYVPDLFLSVVTVSMRTLEIVDALPGLVFGEDGSMRAAQADGAGDEGR